MDAELRYQQLLNTTSDIRAHLSALRALSTGTVVEFGVRGGNSTVALLAGQPDSLLSVDLNPCPAEIFMLAGRTKFQFLQADTREIDIPPCDLLFIDTWHTYAQLKAELTRHAAKARRIALHDTETFGQIGEDGGPGLWPAIEELGWRVESHSKLDNGFTVLVPD